MFATCSSRRAVRVIGATATTSARFNVTEFPCLSLSNVNKNKTTTLLNRQHNHPKTNGYGSVCCGLNHPIMIAHQSRFYSSKLSFLDLGIVNNAIASSSGNITGTTGARKRVRPRVGGRKRKPSKLTPYKLNVTSVHAAQFIDTIAAYGKVFVGSSGLSQLQQSSIRHKFGKTSMLIELKPIEMLSSSSSLSISNENIVPPSYTNPSAPRFVAVFRFGSVVFFNVAPKDAQLILQSIKKQAGYDPVSAGFERRESFQVAVQPTLQENAYVVNGDYCVVRELDMDCAAVISNVMAQTVALDSYSDTVDELLSKFASINATVTQTGNFTEMEKDSLFRVVAHNNSIFIDMISKLGIKDRSEIAWNLSQYDKVNEVSEWKRDRWMDTGDQYCIRLCAILLMLTCLTILSISVT